MAEKAGGEEQRWAAEMATAMAAGACRLAACKAAASRGDALLAKKGHCDEFFALRQKAVSKGAG